MTELGGPFGGPEPELARLREEIDKTRGELGGTVEELAARADVKARAQDAVAAARRQVLTTASVTASRAREQVLDKAGMARAKLPEPVRRVSPAGWMAVVAVVVALVVWRRRRR